MTVFYETLTMMAAGSLAACVVLAVGLPNDGWLFRLALGSTFVTGLPVLPAIGDAIPKFPHQHDPR